MCKTICIAVITCRELFHKTFCEDRNGPVSCRRQRKERHLVRPTIVQLAKAAGVSPTTVSHAFSGRRHVDPDTRERILALAAEIGYRANPRAQRLRTGGAGTIALASSMPFAVAGGPSRLGFLMEIAASAALTAMSRSLALCLVPPLQPDFDLDGIEVDGAILVEPTADDALVDHFLRRGVPIVSIGRPPGDPSVPWVDMRSTAAARLLLEHLWRPGGRIALVTGRQRRNSYIETEAAYDAFAAERGFAPVAIRIDEAEGEAGAAEAVERLLHAHPGIDALCVPVDAFATGSLVAARRAGRAVPRTLRIATRYDGMRARLAAPPITALDLHLDRVAEVGIDLLVSILEGREPSHGPIPKPELIARGSSSPTATPPAGVP